MLHASHERIQHRRGAIRDVAAEDGGPRAPCEVEVVERWAIRYSSLVAVTDAGDGPFSRGAVSRSTSSLPRCGCRR